MSRVSKRRPRKLAEARAYDVQADPSRPPARCSMAKLRKVLSILDQLDSQEGRSPRG